MSNVTAVEVSLLVTSYNFRPFLRTAIESLLAQETEFTFEIILVDDASPDFSLNAIADLVDDRLKVHANAVNLGCIASINKAFSLARGRYIARLDGDDVWAPNFVQTLACALRDNPDAVLAYAGIQFISADGITTPTSLDRPPGPILRDEFAYLLQKHYTCAPSMLSRRSAWQALLPWPERFRDGLGDWHYNLELAKIGKFVYVGAVLASYRVHPGGMHASFTKNCVGERITREILAEHLPTLLARAPKINTSEVYARHLLQIAHSYVQADMSQDARRLYLEVLRLSPRQIMTRQACAAAVGTILLGTARYTRVKRALGFGGNA